MNQNCKSMLSTIGGTDFDWLWNMIQRIYKELLLLLVVLLLQSLAPTAAFVVPIRPLRPASSVGPYYFRTRRRLTSSWNQQPKQSRVFEGIPASTSDDHHNLPTTVASASLLAPLTNEHEDHDLVLESFVSKVQTSLQSNTFQSFTIFVGSSSSSSPTSTKRGGNDRRTNSSSPSPSPSPSQPGSLKLVTGRLVQLKPRKIKRSLQESSSNPHNKSDVKMHTTFKYNGATDIVKNWELDDTSTHLRQLLLQRQPEALMAVASEWGWYVLLPVGGPIIRRAILETRQGVWELTTTSGTKKYQLKFRSSSLKNGAAAPNTAEHRLSHDQTKQVPLPRTIDFWQALGVTNAVGQPKPGMASKLRQCQKFVEIVAQQLVLPSLVSKDDSRSTNTASWLSPKQIRITDMGCGRGYLTFALHTYVQQQQTESSRYTVHTVGIDVRPKLVTELNTIVQSLNISNLHFQEGTIQDSMVDAQDVSADDESDDDPFQVVIALHACNTATDDAIYAAIQQHANVIVTAPCCHKELRPQINQLQRQQPHHPLKDVLQHGIYRERTAETITDTLRALLLELAGYQTRVFEFVGGEHTAKNCMITALLRPVPTDNHQAEVVRKRIQELAAFYGISHHQLATWMKEESLLCDAKMTPSSELDRAPGLSTRKMPAL